MTFQTEIEFTLPKGYLDGDGQLHREGVMRLATAADEILPLKDPRVQQNPAYLTVIVLARVIVRLGSLSDVNTKIVEGLFASDLSYLQALYEQVNGDASEAGAGPFERASREFGVMGEA
ncbi:MAG: hypothetical protein QOE79_18 [Sphingomonadales bacterium]|jgi:hypothetical protein|nr:hypothetical protein [Sphingomonadales bacterium]